MIKYLFYFMPFFLCCNNNSYEHDENLSHTVKMDSLVFCALLCEEQSDTAKYDACCKSQSELYYIDTYLEKTDKDSLSNIHLTVYEKHGHIGGEVTYTGSGNIVYLDSNRKINDVKEIFSFYCNRKGLLLSRELIVMLSENMNIPKEFCDELGKHGFLFKNDNVCN